MRIARLMGRYFIVALAAALALPGTRTPAQQPGPDDLPIISVDVDLVNILFSVRDRRGRLVSNLTQADFTIEEEGWPQTVKYFSRQTDLPITLGLLVDTSISQGAIIEQEKMASSQFFSQVLRVRKDQAFLISFDISVDLLQDLTDSQKLLKDALEKLRVNTSVAGLHPGPVPTGRPKGTLFYDAVFLAAEDVLKSQVGRKALVLITDGNDFGSQMNLRQTIEAAQKSDVIIYGVLHVDRQFYHRRGGTGMIGGYGNGSELKKMCEETGGRMFEVSRKMSLQAIYDQIQEELRSQYSAGYTPSEDRGAAFREIKIIPKDRNLKVQARKGYYPKGPVAK
jgi:VWFA-related protein